MFCDGEGYWGSRYGCRLNRGYSDEDKEEELARGYPLEWWYVHCNRYLAMLPVWAVN